MSKGTASGLLDETRAQSVFKHEILERYIIQFVILTGRRPQRAVLLDGFAGRGRYPDGKPASGEQMLRAAQKSKQHLTVEVVLVEKQKVLYEHLNKVTDEYRSRGVAAEAHHGQVQDYLDGVLDQAQGVPLFLFLDPCGRNLPFDTLSTALKSRRSLRPQTEALLNISADLIRRAAGMARNEEMTDHTTLCHVDTMCGGRWWRQVALDAHESSQADTWESAAEAVVHEYARRLGLVTGMRPVVVPVRRKQHHQPVYHLVFLTRSEYGLWVFGDAVATARQAWMKALGPSDDEVEGMLFDTVEYQIESEQDAGLRTITGNLLDLAASHRQIKLVDHTHAVFGGCYGVAQEKLVRKAARELANANKIVLNATPKRPRDWTIGPAQQ